MYSKFWINRASETTTAFDAKVLSSRLVPKTIPEGIPLNSITPAVLFNIILLVLLSIFTGALKYSFPRFDAKSAELVMFLFE